MVACLKILVSLRDQNGASIIVVFISNLDSSRDVSDDELEVISSNDINPFFFKEFAKETKQIGDHSNFLIENISQICSVSCQSAV